MKVCREAQTERKNAIILVTGILGGGAVDPRYHLSLVEDPNPKVPWWQLAPQQMEQHLQSQGEETKVHVEKGIVP